MIWDWEREDVFVLRGVRVGVHHAAGDVGHVEARHKKCCRDGEGANVPFDFGFRVKVLDAGVFAVCDYYEMVS